MFNFLTKIIFIWKKPKIIVVAGNSRQTASEAIFQVLNCHSLPVIMYREGRVEKKSKAFGTNFFFQDRILLIEAGSQEISKLKWLVNKSKLPILVVTNIGDIPPDVDFFAGDRGKVREIMKLVEILPASGFLILNFDDETIREFKDKTKARSSTFGFQEMADFRATDIGLAQFPSFGTNFKLNYQGNIIPVWLKNLFGKRQIYAALVSAVCGNILGLNFVEISQALRFYQSLPGKMRLIKGIKNSWILDDAATSTVFSMVEAIEILGKLPGPRRKIAVLGDIIGIGKYTIEAHEAIGEKVVRAADLLFTFGPRAKFIAKGASEKGMAVEKIFQFDTIDEGKLKLQEEIKENDLILVDGSKEIDMERVVEEIKE